MGKFNSNEYYTYYCGQESLRINGVALIVNKSRKCSTWMQFQKWQHDLCSFPRQTIQYHGNPSLCPRQQCWRSLSWTVLWRPTRPSTKNKNRCPFHHRGLECKSMQSRDTWSNRHVWPWNTEWSRAKANRVLPRAGLVIANTLFQQHKRRLYTWTLPDGQHRNQTDYILCGWRWRNSIQSTKTRQEADCGSDHQLLIAKFRLKLKKVRKTTRPFRYDLNQIPYDYTVEVRNRFKGLDLIECLKNYGWRFMTLYRSQWSRPFPRKRNAKRQNGCLRRPYK